ncbi:MAG: response regulator [Myxococcaceae bacterium]
MSEAKLMRLLCVDDEPKVLSGLERNLRKVFPVVTAVGGEAALEMLKKDRDFAVIVSDMRMPGMDGATFLSAARLLLPDASRILLTGQADLDAVIKAVNSGNISYYLRKPVDNEELVRVVHTGFADHREAVTRREKIRELSRAGIDLMLHAIQGVAPSAKRYVARVHALALDLGQSVGISDDFGLGIAAELAALADQIDRVSFIPKALTVLAMDEALAGAHRTLEELNGDGGNLSAMARVVRASLQLARIEVAPNSEREAARHEVEPRMLEVFDRLAVPA